ncbi:site-specific integrase [Xanthomonas vasicola]|uniref:Integrase n=1 Tax=Xanthomonas vasicola pv. vasculorum NCPPB 890 TaxID=1184265 RepID=A0A836P516_XANVA|nr:site-specific integrase [Xanthomonas vasicola]KFA28671.1 integrase [Xanthomonas vasicola pv. vasculorum NCPPB 1326]KFA35315.1 integrase [Xanthomonas vasicola pv. vasculorum NCPPB 1381]MBV6748589.1 site-specific integrase [Xanthomonas vasicola pv. vasculorum NCPPB 890]MBV6894260.1 site-specific integrase [Xanthomonas vasicola pv. vasculorum]MDO6950115.1 site-specific integrase [Xanthomonas vasicola]
MILQLPQLQHYLQQPTGDLFIEEVRSGKSTFRNIRITSRAGAVYFQDLVQATLDDQERKRRLRRSGTRYPEPLPLATPARLLSEEVKDFLNDKDRQGREKSTIDSYRRTLAILQRVTGDISVARINYTHIYEMWDVLRWAPEDFMSNPAYQHLDVKGLIAKGQSLGRTQPANSTLELHRRFLNSFFNKIAKAEGIPHSPMAAFEAPKSDLLIEEDDAERLLSTEEVQKIFDPKTFTPWAKKYPHRWWCPLIALYTGARINEISQLKVSDIVQDQGVWCFSIQKTVDKDLAKSKGKRSRQRLKGKSAIRKVPVHEALIQAGFLDFVADIVASGHPRLFPNLSAGVNEETGESNGRYSQGFVNQFAVYLKGLGFGKGIGSHAFRHTLATELDAKGVRVEDIALITGHSLNKKVPVLQDSYFHKSPGNVRKIQVEALALYHPPVTLPGYVRGQFKERLSRDAKTYP